MRYASHTAESPTRFSILQFDSLKSGMQHKFLRGLIFPLQITVSWEHTASCVVKVNIDELRDGVQWLLNMIPCWLFWSFILDSFFFIVFFRFNYL